MAVDLKRNCMLFMSASALLFCLYLCYIFDSVPLGEAMGNKANTIGSEHERALQYTHCMHTTYTSTAQYKGLHISLVRLRKRISQLALEKEEMKRMKGEERRGAERLSLFPFIYTERHCHATTGQITNILTPDNMIHFECSINLLLLLVILNLLQPRLYYTRAFLF